MHSNGHPKGWDCCGHIIEGCGCGYNIDGGVNACGVKWHKLGSSRTGR